MNKVGVGGAAYLGAGVASQGGGPVLQGRSRGRLGLVEGHAGVAVQLGAEHLEERNTHGGVYCNCNTHQGEAEAFKHLLEDSGLKHDEALGCECY